MRRVMEASESTLSKPGRICNENPGFLVYLDNIDSRVELAGCAGGDVLS